MILMCFVVAVGLLDVYVREHRVGEIHTGQFDLALIAFDCCDDHPLIARWKNDLSCPRHSSTTFLCKRMRQRQAPLELSDQPDSFAILYSFSTDVEVVSSKGNVAS